jgi:Uma2 family endonuclease
MVFSPQQSEHAASIANLTVLLPPLFGPGFHLRVQLPVDLGQTTEPEPDITLVTGTPQAYRQSHPTTAALLIEVSDTTLGYDRGRKGSLYARAGILDYWIVNLRRKQLEVYRAPIPDSTQRYGHRYSSRTDLLDGATVSPLALPHLSLAVTDLLG